MGETELSVGSRLPCSHLMTTESVLEKVPLATVGVNSRLVLEGSTFRAISTKHR